ncbi:hypothetical protein PILCRDRAFT_814697 [Piloderma croceum F 1598]|uniref:DNA polymerase epsilon subunit D n=1 Tax=Piloderma croceum (strain F 1598) TaxID=765440 RepID=A0A0C3GBK9_PILCF|nr:hypothetical protein PILCRDRAFT_814697 [Piloderma croceum F 1598]
MPRKESASGQISALAQQEQVSDGIENYELPKNLVTKIAKAAIPDSAKLQKETILSLVKGSTVFINYLAATAHDVATSKQHKSISASDVLKALEIIEFGDLNDMLQSELQIYRNNMKTDKAKKERAEKAAATASAKGKAKEVDPSANLPASASISISAPKSKSKAPTSASGAATSISGSTLAPGMILPSPFTSAPRMPAMSADSAPSSQPQPQILRDDNEEMDIEEEEGAGDEDVEVDVDVDEVEEEEEEEEGVEEVQDMIAVEEEEMRKDAKMVEEGVEDA